MVPRFRFVSCLPALARALPVVTTPKAHPEVAHAVVPCQPPYAFRSRRAGNTFSRRCRLPVATTLRACRQSRSCPPALSSPRAIQASIARHAASWRSSAVIAPTTPARRRPSGAAPAAQWRQLLLQAASAGRGSRHRHRDEQQRPERDDVRGECPHARNILAYQDKDNVPTLPSGDNLLTTAGSSGLITIFSYAAAAAAAHRRRSRSTRAVRFVNPCG
jgi:hypothetical protein